MARGLKAKPRVFKPFPNNTVLFRAAMQRSWFSTDGRRGAPPAFYRRPLTHSHPDAKGLSVDDSQATIIRKLTKEFYGFISLEVGQIKSLGLAVKRDGITHANIDSGSVELPFRDERDLAALAKCEAIAIKLANLSIGYPQLFPAKPAV